MQRAPIRSVLVVVALLAMLLVSFTVSAQPVSTEAGAVRWLTYVDPRFDFSIRYPSNWQVLPRDDSDPNAVSGILVFVPISEQHNAANADLHEPGPHVIVVPYLAELEDGQSLSEWTEMYESLGHASDRAAIQRQPRRVFRVNGAKAVHEEGVSPLTTYQFTNIAHKNMVWDVWTNISSTDPLATIYNRMVRSFRFGRSAPTNLQGAYGSGFTPMDMNEVAKLETKSQSVDLQAQSNDQQLGSGPGINALTSSWKAPVRKVNNGGKQFDAKCGSKDHDDEITYASLAIDIYMPKYTPVYNAKIGTAIFAGFQNTGYGNLIEIQAQGGKIAYYAHLHMISSMTVVGSLISTYVFIGSSGNTTFPANPAYPYHLHFHVQWGTSPEDLRGMEGFSATSYPLPDGKHDDGVLITCGTIGI